MFTKVQIYCKSNCSFSDIERSTKPFLVINTDQISSLGPREVWAICSDRYKYPYRVLDMNNGDQFLVVLESANELEELLLHTLE